MALVKLLYAFAAASQNNGSAFAGLKVNTHFYNLALGIAMLIGRTAITFPMLALAGSMASKKIAPITAGTFETTSGLFSGLLVSVILIVGALTFFPALALGPIVEQVLMWAGKAF